jgi:Zn-dependent protease/CBS domain-containing protein
MKNNTIILFRVNGIPVGLDPSWFLVFALITWALSISYFPDEFKNWSRLQYWSVAAVTSILFFVCVMLHELGHSLVALKYKMPVKSITMYIFGGISEINAEPTSATQEFVISLAGPLTSILLALIFYLLELLFRSVAPIFAMVKYLALINAILAVFNLIPGFPLDGGRVFRAIVWGITHNMRRATEIASYLGHAIAFSFILIGVWRLFQGDWTNGLWIAFIGWFLENAVVGQVQQLRIQHLLSGHTVGQVMTRSCAQASADITLQDLVDQYVLARGQRCLVLMEGPDAIGLLTMTDIRHVAREAWANTPATEVMTPMDKVHRTTPTAGLDQAFEQMGAEGINQMPVMENGQIEGMLSREDIMDYLHLLQKMGK